MRIYEVYGYGFTILFTNNKVKSGGTYGGFFFFLFGSLDDMTACGVLLKGMGKLYEREK